MRRWVVVAGMVAGCQPMSGSGYGYQQPYAPAQPPSSWQHVTAAGPPVDRMAMDRCQIAVHQDDYYGFTVGHPDGWKIDYSTGTLIVERDDSGAVGAMIYPARIRRTDVTPDQVAQMFGDSIGNRIRAAGGTFELQDKVTDGQVATATVIASINGNRLRGPLQVIATPGFMTLKVYWAPESELAQDEPTLRQVMTCFKRKTVITQKAPVPPRGGLLTKIAAKNKQPTAGPAEIATQPYRDRFFAMKTLPGLKIVSESEHGLDMIANDQSIGFGFGYVLNPMTRADMYAIQSLQQWFPGSQVITQGWVQAPQGWMTAQIEYTQQLQTGVVLHGILRVSQGQGVLLSFGWRTIEPIWQKYNTTLAAMANSIQIQPAAVAQVQQGIRQQLASYPPVQSSVSSSSSGSSWDAWNKSVSDRWASEDKRNQGFDDAILGQDHTRSPSSGETYVVPNNAWSDQGPQGAGYYRELPGGGTEKLEVQGTDYQ